MRLRRWHVEFRERVLKREVPKLPKDVKLILDVAIEDLKREGPFPYGWNVREIEKGKNRMWLENGELCTPTSEYRYVLKSFTLVQKKMSPTDEGGPV